jgi:alpha-mannosidase
MREFFLALEGKYRAGIPVHKLGWPDYWTDGVASTAYETGLNRIAHNTLLTAEKLAALAGEVNPEFFYPRAEINEGYNRSMFYDEHTWGAYNSIDDPDSELARSQWAHKSGFAYEASETGRTLLAKGLAAVAGRIRRPAEFSLAVFNPLSWERTDVVRVSLPEKLVERKGNFRVRDGRTGGEVAIQPIDDRTVLFLAGDVPALGYVVYTISAEGVAEPKETKAAPAAASLESRFYRIVVDQANGGIRSLFDKDQGVELVDNSGPFRLNQYIYENPEGGRKAVDNMEKRAVFRRASATSADLLPGWQGPVASSLKIRMTAPGCRYIESEIVLYEGIRRVDIVNRLRKEDTAIPEAVYFAFPFKVDGGNFIFEIADAAMRPEVDQLPGTTRDWHTVQHWVEASNAESSVVWSPIEAPLVQFGEINTGKWLKTLDLRNASAFSYAMNNYWMTNFKASQGGLTTFRYALTSRAGGSDQVHSSRFGWEVHTPLVAGWIPEESKETLRAAEASFFEVDQANVILQALKRAEDGRGLILRLREIAGRDTEVRVKSPLWQGKKISALLTDIAEGDEKAAYASEDGIAVPVKAFGIQSVRILIPK